MLNKLVALSNKLDRLGLSKDADFIDNFIQKLSSDENNEWDDIPTVVDPVAQGIEPMPPLKELLDEHRRKQERHQTERRSIPRAADRITGNIPVDIYHHLDKSLKMALEYEALDTETKRLILALIKRLAGTTIISA